MRKNVFLVTGANGQIGTVLVENLRQLYGKNQVISTDIRAISTSNGPLEIVDVLDREQLVAVVEKYKVTHVFHLAAILSAKGEQNPQLAWKINMDGLFNVLEVAKEYKLKVFYPSSIAVFGSESPQNKTPQELSAHPETVYGISKLAGEYWCNYYHMRYGVDVRSLRYPGLISYQSMPGGGTTDYAVDIFHHAVKGEAFNCFLSANTALPMMYMPDAVRATMEIMAAPASKIRWRTSYNLAGISITPRRLTLAIKKHFPDFQVDYEPDFRQAIADKWSNSIDDKAAQKDWGWKMEFGLDEMVADMIKNLNIKYNKKDQLINTIQF
ncbi:MAG: NAD-dependent epimerase/dehydratase family protein [Bacteroidota bacterium]